MNNELTHYQLLLLGNTTGGTGRIDIKVKGDSLYRKIYWCHLKGGKRIRGWLPILTYDGKDWIGYNYSARDMASELMVKEYMFRHYYHNLKWVEIGRGIGCKGTARFWRWTGAFQSFITKMINPTEDMLLPDDTVFDEE